MDFYQKNVNGAFNHTTATDDDASVPYRITQGTYPTDLSGNGYYTAWDRSSANKAVQDGQTVLGASFLSSPGRVLRLNLDTKDPDAPVHAHLKTLRNAAYHLRSIAPESFLRDTVAEVSIFGVSNLANVAPIPFSKTGDGHRLLIGCDPAIPTEISPSSLDVHGPVGFRSEWQPFIDGTLMPMTMTGGHPFFDPNDGPSGTLYLPELLIRPPIRPSSRFGAYPRLVTWNGTGKLNGPFGLTGEDGRLIFFPEASIHQVGATRDYVLLAMTPISFGVSTLIIPAIERILRFLPPGAAQWARDLILDISDDSAQLPLTEMLILRKEDIRKAERDNARTIPCKRTSWEWEISHFFCDYENPNDQITLFAALSIGFDVTKSLQTGDTLLDSRKVPPELNTIFSAATDLQVCGRYILDATSNTPPLDIKLTPSRDPEDPRLPLGVMLQIPTAPVSYKPIGSTEYDLGAISKKWDHTFWCSTGWMPVMESQEVFDIYRQTRVLDPLREGKPPQRYIIDETAFLDASRKPTNNAVLYRLDRDMELELDKDVYTWPAGWLASAPFFAPRPNATSVDDGYMINLVCSDVPDSHMQVWIFDTSKPLADGPVCVLEPDRDEPFRIGYPLHSIWMDSDSVEDWQPPSYKVPLVEPPVWMSLLDVGYLASSYVRSAVRSRVVDFVNLFL